MAVSLNAVVGGINSTSTFLSSSRRSMDISPDSCNELTTEICFHLCREVSWSDERDAVKRNLLDTTAKYQNLPRFSIGASVTNATHFAAPSGLLLLSRPKKGRPLLLVANSDRLITEVNDKASEKTKPPLPLDQSSPSSKLESVNQIPEIPNGSTTVSDLKQDDDAIKTPIKRTRLTARAKLNAAIVSRNSETKARTKPQLGRNVLDALKEIDKRQGKAGLPEAPSNMLDDSKRGMPPKGLTWELPVGIDVALIIFSVVFISTVMFTTTYIVWKVGAIHFNEY